LYNGAELCIDDSRGKSTDRLIQNWKAYDPTIFFAVPRVHDILVAQSLQRREAEEILFGGRLRFVFSAGALLPAPVETAYRAHGIPVVEGWGQTETSPCVTVTTTDTGWRSGYVGKPLPGVSIRIDADQEILVKGPNVMEGYFDSQEDTAHVVGRDGWFRTGDLGEYTRDGLHLLGRKDGTFKLTTGDKVHPLGIETSLVTESPYIRSAVVFGSGKDYVGVLVYPDFENLQAWAASQGIESAGLVTDPKILDLFKREIGRINPLIEVKHHRVKRAVLADRGPSRGNGEVTPSGKLVHKAVLKNYQKKIDALFAPDPAEDVIQIDVDSAP